LAALLLLGRISRVTPPASAATRVHVSSGRSAAVDATMVAEAAQTAVADVPIVADALAADHVSNTAGQVARGTTGVIKEAILGHRAVRSSFPKC